MISDVARGSNWLKCDLHVHTPASFFHQYGDAQSDDTWNKFIANLEALPAEFKIIGINDYLTLDGYKRVLEVKRQPATKPAAHQDDKKQNGRKQNGPPKNNGGRG